MKKALVLLLALMVVMGLSLAAVACGDEEVATDDGMVDDGMVDDSADDAMDDAAAVLDWSDAKANIGTTATVSGPVVSVNLLTFADNKILVNIGEETEDGFCVAIEGYDTDKFTGLDDTMVGKTVTVTGEIYENEFDHWAEIAITDPSEWTVE